MHYLTDADLSASIVKVEADVNAMHLDGLSDSPEYQRARNAWDLYVHEECYRMRIVHAWNVWASTVATEDAPAARDRRACRDHTLSEAPISPECGRHYNTYTNRYVYVPDGQAHRFVITYISHDSRALLEWELIRPNATWLALAVKSLGENTVIGIRRNGVPWLVRHRGKLKRYPW